MTKPVIVAGCIPQSDSEKLKDYSLIGVRAITRIIEAAEKTLRGEKVQFLDDEQTINLPRIRKNEFVEIIPISNGCMGHCTFCKTKQARGELKSFDKKSIVDMFRQALNDGVKEVWLTSEDLGAWGLDINSTLPQLLKDILKVNRNFKLRLGMINPEYVKMYNDELIKILQDERVFKFLHVPVQSASNKVLKLMGRPYIIEDFKDSILKIKSVIPNLTLASDIICGFPNEEDEDFEKTVKLVRELKIPVLNISKFYARPGTPAKKLKPIPTHIVKERSKRLSDMRQDIIDNSFWIGQVQEILVDNTGKNNSFVGRNDSYRPVVLKGDNLLGKKVKVKIISENKDNLVGEIIN